MFRKHLTLHDAGICLRSRVAAFDPGEIRLANDGGCAGGRVKPRRIGTIHPARPTRPDFDRASGVNSESVLTDSDFHQGGKHDGQDQNDESH
jgi:hypothetical protein